MRRSDSRGIQFFQESKRITTCRIASAKAFVEESKSKCFTLQPFFHIYLALWQTSLSVLARNGNITFPKLKKLILNGLPRLTAFCKGIESIEFPLLEEIRLVGCPKCRNLVSCTGNNQNSACGNDDDDDSLHLFRCPKVAFGSLKNVEISGYENIRNIWCHQIPIDFFRGLEELLIRCFVSIKSLFSSSVAANLVNLRHLDIDDCPEMVKVIADEEKLNCDKSQILPNLVSLKLYNLPKLETFCEWRCALELPSLKDVSIEKCPQMKCLTMGPLSTPKLTTIDIDYENIDMVDLNGVLKQKRSRAEESAYEEEQGQEAESSTSIPQPLEFQGEMEEEAEDNSSA